MIGRRLSHYRIEERLGAGGMGEVFRARDEKLERDVALKVLPSGALADEEARHRFRKEAAVLSRLSHPHIATLHDFDSAEGIDFLVMELVRGPTVEQWLRKGPLPEKDVIRLGSQLTRGLIAAHEQGVIHRDLKPSNLQLTSDGLLKILDFGVAHLERGGAPAGGEATATETAAGEVLGSPPYMAPEQLLGKPVDARADLYAAGACLYELATGKRPHGDKRGPQLTEAILHEAPVAPRTANGSLSPGLESVILKALDKDPELRYQTGRELLVDLERLMAGATSRSASQVAVAKTRPRLWPWLVVASVIGVGAVAAWLLAPPPRPRITGARPLTSGSEAVDAFRSWATDGERVYFVRRGNPDTYDRASTELLQIPVAGGEGTPVATELPASGTVRIHAFLAGESALLMAGSERYVAEGEVGWPLWIVPVPAGAPSRLGTVQALAAAPSPDGRLLAVSQKANRLAVLRRDGTLVREWPGLASPPDSLTWSPDGQRLRFSVLGPDGRQPWVWQVVLGRGEPQPLWPGSGGCWSGDGRYFFFTRGEGTSSGNLPFSRERRDLYAAREPRLAWLPAPPPDRLTFGPMSFWQLGSSPGGARLFVSGELPRGEIVRYDVKSGRYEKYLDGASAFYAEPSSDGDWVAYVSYPEGTLWRSRVDGRERVRLTEPGWEVHLPRWSPDATTVAFAGRPRETEGMLSVWSVGRDGGEPEVLARSPVGSDLWDPCWLPDGRTVVYSHREFADAATLGLYRVDVPSRAVSPLPGGGRLRYPKCSPGGDILGYELGAQPYRGVYWAWFADQARWERIGPLGLAYPSWSRDGRFVTGLAPLRQRIERWSRASGAVEPVVSLARERLLSWLGATWVGLAADGSPLVVRDRSTRDLYALDWEAP